MQRLSVVSNHIVANPTTGKDNNFLSITDNRTGIDVMLQQS